MGLGYKEIEFSDDGDVAGYKGVVLGGDLGEQADGVVSLEAEGDWCSGDGGVDPMIDGGAQLRGEVIAGRHGRYRSDLVHAK